MDYDPKASNRVVKEREDGTDGYRVCKSKLIGRQSRGWSGWRGRGGTRMTGRRRRSMKGAERVVNAVRPHVCGDIGRKFAARP